MSERFHRLELGEQVESAPLAQAQSHTQSQRVAEHDEHHWLRLADQDRRNGLYESALRYYSRALECNRTVIVAWLGQVQMLIALGEYPEAELWARKALELFRSHSGLLAGRAQALCRLGKLKEAHAASDGALAQQGESAYRWMVRGELMLARRERVEEHCFERAVQVDPDWLVRLEIAAIYLHYRILAKALVRARQAAELAPDHAHCWFVQGAIESQMRLSRSARQSLRRCLELAPTHVEARRRLQQLEERPGWRTLFGWLGG